MLVRVSRRLFTTLVIAALAACAWMLARVTTQDDDAGPVAHVLVVDAEGRALATARVRARHGGEWQRVDAQGRVRMAGVALRDQEAPSPDAVAAALEVEERTHAMPPGRGPEAKARTDGDGVEVRFQLVEVGLLRLSIEPTTLGDVRAWILPGPGGEPVSAVGAQGVARVGRPATFRVFGSAEAVVARIEGEEHLVHGTRVATRLRPLPAPAPGHVLERRLVAEPRTPIRGRVLRPEGFEGLPLSGRVRVVEVVAESEGGAWRAHLPDVPLAPDGTFLVPFVGAGSFELEAEVGGLGRTRLARVEGGADVELALADPPQAVEVVLTPAPDERAGPARLAVQREGGQEGVLSLAPDAEGRARVPLPRSGLLRLRATVEGSAAMPPSASEPLHLDAADLPLPIVLPLGEAPHGALLVALAPEAARSFRGASVRAAGREASLLKGFATEVRFPHLAVGPVAVEVSFADEEMGWFLAQVAVEAGGETRLEVACLRGGPLVVALPREGDGDARAPSALWLAWDAGDTPCPGPGRLLLAPQASLPPRTYGSPGALLPGTWRARVEDAAGGTTEVRFEIRPGVPTHVALPERRP
jgi:hypothetical protein